MKHKTPGELRDVPWITPSGELDPGRFPIESVLRQTISPNLDEFRSACMFLGSMVSHGRAEAGIYLLGLLQHHQDDFRRLEVVVESLGSVREDACVAALFDELRRVKPSNATRRYLDLVVRALRRFPVEMVRAGFQALAADRSFSYRMRTKFAEALESIENERFR